MKPKKVLREEHTLMLTHLLTQSRRGSAVCVHTRIVHISRHKRPILAAGLWSVCVSGHGLSVPQWRGLSGPDLPPVGIRLQLCQWTGRAGNSGVQRCERINTCCVLEKPFASFTCFIKCLPYIDLPMSHRRYWRVFVWNPNLSWIQMWTRSRGSLWTRWGDVRNWRKPLVSLSLLISHDPAFLLSVHTLFHTFLMLLCMSRRYTLLQREQCLSLENICLNVTASCFGAVCYQLMAFRPCTSLNC